MAGLAIGLPFLLEPVARRVYDGLLKCPSALWLLEGAVGLTLVSAVLVARRPLTETRASAWRLLGQTAEIVRRRRGARPART